MDALKQAVKEKEEEVGRLSSQLEAKETEKQKLLAQVERQSQQEEDELVQLTAEVCELRASLMEAEDRRMRAEVELEDLKSRKSVIKQVMVRGDYVHFKNLTPPMFFSSTACPPELQSSWVWLTLW